MASLRNQARAYWRAARAPRYSLLFALPLLALYEGLAAMLGTGTMGGVRNGADVLLKSAFAAVLGARGPLVFGALLIAGSAWLVARDMRRSGKLEARYFSYMLAESVALGLLVGLVVGAATVQLLRPFGALAWTVDATALALTPVERLGWSTRLMISLGAGLYEELLFRVLLVSGIAWAARTGLGWRALPAGVLATVLGAFLFSLAHYVGPYGDVLAVPSFTFRFVAGLFFSGLYLLRGFGITAWTHALYDVFLLVW